ncbi:hypothetical protein TNCV_3204351 [Trichonephila clavipes]|nr:hypothetical protein TNCV_3204351 [Trichonephila clavipes]
MEKGGASIESLRSTGLHITEKHDKGSMRQKSLGTSGLSHLSQGTRVVTIMSSQTVDNELSPNDTEDPPCKGADVR